jgi:hypothetical protein
MNDDQLLPELRLPAPIPSGADDDPGRARHRLRERRAAGRREYGLDVDPQDPLHSQGRRGEQPRRVTSPATAAWAYKSQLCAGRARERSCDLERSPVVVRPRERDYHVDTSSAVEGSLANGDNGCG